MYSTFSCTVCTCWGSSSLFYFHIETLPVQSPFPTLVFHYLACVYTSWVLFQSLIKIIDTGPIFCLGSSGGVCSEERGLVPLWPSSSPMRLRFLGLVILTQLMDLAQPVTAFIKGQCTLNHRHKFLQKVFSEKAHLEVPIWTESIIINTFHRFIKFKSTQKSIDSSETKSLLRQGISFSISFLQIFFCLFSKWKIGNLILR